MTLADLLAPRDRAAIKADLLSTFDAKLIALGRPPVTATWGPGNALDLVMDLVSSAVAFGDATAARLARGTSRALATEAGSFDLLRALATDVYGVTPIDALPASGTVVVTAAVGAGFWVASGVDRFRNPATGAIYTAVESVQVPSGGSASVLVNGPAPGTGYDTGPGTITEPVITRAGVTCTNPAAVVGLEGETIAALSRRMQLAPIARAPQPTRAKYEFEAKNVTAHGVPVNRVRVARSGADVRVVASTASGGLTGPQLAALQTYLINTVLGDSGLFTLVSATTVPLAATNRVVTLWAPATDATPDATVLGRASAIVAGEMAACPIGGYRRGTGSGYASDLLGARLIAGLGLVDVDNLPPDVAMPLGTEVPVVGSLTFEVRRST